MWGFGDLGRPRGVKGEPVWLRGSGPSGLTVDGRGGKITAWSRPGGIGFVIKQRVHCRVALACVCELGMAGRRQRRRVHVCSTPCALILLGAKRGRELGLRGDWDPSGGKLCSRNGAQAAQGLLCIFLGSCHWLSPSLGRSRHLTNVWLRVGRCRQPPLPPRPLEPLHP